MPIFRGTKVSTSKRRSFAHSQELGAKEARMRVEKKIKENQKGNNL